VGEGAMQEPSLSIVRATVLGAEDIGDDEARARGFGAIVFAVDVDCTGFRCVVHSGISVAVECRGCAAVEQFYAGVVP
jgi:hypothetical protein